MDVIRYMNCCIVEFGRRLGLEPKWACRYLYLHGGLELLDKNYQAEHLLPAVTFICMAVLNYWIKTTKPSTYFLWMTPLTD